jgi:hypothetical protein
MRYLREASIRLHGDIHRAQQYIGLARTMLGEMFTVHTLGGGEGFAPTSKSMRLADGTQVSVSYSPITPTITITAPPPVSEEPPPGFFVGPEPEPEPDACDFNWSVWYRSDYTYNPFTFVSPNDFTFRIRASEACGGNRNSSPRQHAELETYITITEPVVLNVDVLGTGSQRLFAATTLQWEIWHSTAHLSAFANFVAGGRDLGQGCVAGPLSFKQGWNDSAVNTLGELNIFPLTLPPDTYRLFLLFNASLDDLTPNNAESAINVRMQCSYP